MDVDNTEEHKEQSISKQEQINRKNIFLLFSQWSKYNNASQTYKTRKLYWSERKTRTVFDHYKIFREFAEDNRKSQSRSPRKIEDEHAKYILSEVYNRIIIKNLWTIIKSKFNIDVGRTRIVEILNKNGYKYRSPKLRLKIEIQH